MILYVLFLVSVVGATTPNLVSPPAECFTNYACFVPMKCIDPTTPDPDNEIIKVRRTDKVDDKCSLFLMIHPFAYNWYRIIMESFTNTKKIELRHSVPNLSDPDNNVVETLTCSTDGTDVKVLRTIGTEPPAEINLNDKSVKPLKCVFEINGRSATEKISEKSFNMEDTEAITHETTGMIQTKKAKISADVYCIPGVFVDPRESFEPDKKYAKVMYKWDDKDNWNKIYCDNPLVFNTIEYSAGDSEKFQKVASFACDKGYKLTLEGTPRVHTLKEDFDVRCVADADYFCDYDPKYEDNGNLNERQLKRDPPNIISANPKKSKLECPEKFRFFVKKGQKAPIENAKFECKNFFGRMKWTFNGTILDDKSPVHCVNEADCNVMHPIPRARLDGSMLMPNKDRDVVPMCLSDGTLKAGEGQNRMEVVEKVFCDRHEGKYKYIVNATGVTKIATDQTIYSCEYPVRSSGKKKEELDMANKDKMIKSIPIAAGVSLAVAAGILIFIICLLKQRMKKANQKLLDADALDSSRFQPGKFQEHEENEGKGLLASDYLINDYLRKRRQEALITVRHTPYPDEVPVKTTEAMLKAKSKENDEFRNQGVRKCEKTTFVRTAFMDEIDELLKKYGLPMHPRAPKHSPSSGLDQESDPAEMEMKTQSEETPRKAEPEEKKKSEQPNPAQMEQKTQSEEKPDVKKSK